jgi:hypothetical protein
MNINTQQIKHNKELPTKLACSFSTVLLQAHFAVTLVLGSNQPLAGPGNAAQMPIMYPWLKRVCTVLYLHVLARMNKASVHVGKYFEV